ncbi:MAG: nucleoside deaminase [Candidatus Taylorbacteria bacterium]|nr:nucleoside deaminase [Candidatus Taylorbacteria bacterium]
MQTSLFTFLAFLPQKAHNAWYMSDSFFIQKAIEKAKESVLSGGFPAGAVVVKDGKIIGEGISIGNKLNDPTSHGEAASIRDACKNLKTSDLSGSTLYASMQPCLMCLGASMWSSISRIVFAVPKEKVSPLYYGGSYDPSTINTTFIRPIELVHLAELEEESLKVVKEWKKTL